MKTLKPTQDQRTLRLSGLIFMGATLLLTCTGYWTFRIERAHVIENEYQMLAGVGELSSRQIQQWREERQSELMRAAKDHDLGEAISELLRFPQSQESQTNLQLRLRTEIAEHEHRGALVFDTDTKLIASNDHDKSPPTEATLRTVREAFSTGQIVFSDLYATTDGTAHMDVASPVLSPTGTAIAVLILRDEANCFLFPLIQTWPTSSKSSESYLVKRDGEEVIYLTGLRHRANTGPPLRLPLSDHRISAVQAVLGKTGRFSGVDYRGVNVFGLIKAVPASPWFLLTEVDTGEVLAGMRNRAYLISLVTGMLILLAGAAIGLFHRQRQSRLLEALIAEERGKADVLATERKAAERNRDILRNALDGFWLLDLQGRILEVNDTYCSMTGYSTEEILSMNVSELDILETHEGTIIHIQKIIALGMDRFESMHRRKDGTSIYFDVSVQYRHGEKMIVAFLRDITESKSNVLKIERLSMLYAALSDSNEAILHFNRADDLLPEICRCVVRRGGIDMAAIVMDKHGKDGINVVASHGTGTEYLSEVEISCDSNNPLGGGPTGCAIREGKAVWCEDFQNAPATLPWHQLGARYGWVASGAIPLRQKGRNVGALMLYSTKFGTFDEDIRHLLCRMAENISFALDNFARESERKAVETELHKLFTAVEQCEETIVITDAMGNIEYANPAFEKISGYSTAEAIGENPRILQSGEHDTAFYQQLWATVSSGMSWRGQFHNRRKDGTLFWESAVISPVLNEKGEIANYVTVKEDITQRKIRDAELRQALSLAESASRVKSEFLAVMSHELRTPLNGVLGFSELLRDTPLVPEQAEYLKTIQESGNHLLKIVNDILDFSSIEKGGMHLEYSTFMVSEMITESCWIARKLAAAKGLDFHCERDPSLPLRITGDLRRIAQILVNLLDNAVKFTNKGEVAIHIKPGLQEGKATLDFAVMDTGPGIPREMLEMLFLPFTQADSTLQRQYDGTGLGLAISNRLAENMGGTIDVLSIEGKGSTFTFRLPLDAHLQASETDADAITPNVPASGARVLVVEDERINRRLASKMLDSLGYLVEHAANGREAVAAATGGDFCVILMDVQMPIMDGLEATRAIRQREAGGRRVPIIALTANVMPGDREKCLTAGMDDFLSKPFKRNDLAIALSRHACQCSQVPSSVAASHL